VTDLYQLAVDLADQAIPSFPCSHSKAPLRSKADGGRGYLDATLDHTPEMWAGAALIGMPTGEPSLIDVLDIDPKDGGCEWLIKNAHKLPRTRCVRTRSGGVHIYLKARPGMRCSASHIAPGVDIRSNGGFVIRWDLAGFPRGIFDPAKPL
jgi:hypothetical protein